MKFKLDVVRGKGSPETLWVDATDPTDAAAQASNAGWIVLSKPVASGLHAILSQASLAHQAQANLRQADLVIFIEQLYALLHAGLSLIEALETLSKGRHDTWQVVINALSNSLRQGQTLSRSMAQHTVFPSLLIAMVQSAEVTSNLPQALMRFLEHEKRSAQLRHQISAVAVYPALLLLVGSGVMVFLLLYVMPRFARVFESMHNLPWSAQAMVTWSHLLQHHGWHMLFVCGLGVAMITAVLMNASYRGLLLAQFLRIKPLADRLRIYFLARWFRTIGMLVEGGIALPESLQLANDVLPLALRDSGHAVELAMRQGLSPSGAFIKAHMTTPVAEQLLRAGERSGDVGLMLTRAAEFHELEVTKSLEKTMRVIEPLVMTIIGIGVGIIVILMYLPIFELASAIQ
jgi:general secretion pathway protein F